ncbi:homoserine O-acetyltransferase [Neobacillus piezotolerans]|uniref:Homoserine O-acetyltransferase n=1 Tax=Neobacillus piezotolerans TaxID=2259171 RepID=A0A3D8GVL3_9BACI|nr:homoserine O-acetyltransferase [Neobacillus piezotolerans]RDU38201.1 homoserine O-acetyltransferase [Neobacillus piezotolerans]
MKAEDLSISVEPAPPPEYGKIHVGDLQLESGEVLPDLELAFERAGKIGGPTILVCHALTGNQYTVGTQNQPGWWHGLIGPGMYIDTNKYEVITVNVLGGCSGSTGPTSLNPLTNQPYQYDFPKITIRDIVDSQVLALRKLGIDKIKAAIGGSLGGMQVLELATAYPDFAELIIPMAVTPSLSDYGIAFNAIGRNAIMRDPAWNGGFYSDGTQISGLEIARMVGMVTYRTGELFNKRFNRELKDGDTFQVESYLKYQGQKLSARFDANSYLYLLGAMDSHDIGRGRQGWKNAIGRISAKTVLLGYTGDLLYPPEKVKEIAEALQEAGKEADYVEVSTDFGHDGFLAEFSKWGGIPQAALSI